MTASQAAPEALAEALLQAPYWIADVLPAQVPADAPGQYFAVEEYYRADARMRPLRRKQAEILLRLNCYADMCVTFDGGEHWERNPDPAAFEARAEALHGHEFLRAVFPAEGLMVDVEPDETWMTLYTRAAAPPDLMRALCAAEGLFLWQPPAP